LIACSQTDFCTAVNKAITGANSNFISFVNYQFKTSGGQSAYLADFNFIAGTPTYVYKDMDKNDIFLYQLLTSDSSQYRYYYKLIEQCLIKETEKWSLVDAADGKAVIFECYKTGAEIMLFATKSGVVLQIKRNPLKNNPVLAADFCRQLEQLTNAAAQQFAPVMGNYKDSGILGKSYQCNMKLNQRGTNPAIYYRKSYTLFNAMEYSCSESFSSSDISYTDLLEKVEQCLNSSSGWIKKATTIADEFDFTKGNVHLTVSKGYLSGTDVTHLRVSLLIPPVIKQTAAIPQLVPFETANRKFGFLNEHGDTVIAAKYAVALRFINGYSIVGNKGPRDFNGFVDANGKETWLNEYDGNGLFFNEGDLLLVRKGQNDNERIGFINGKSQLVIPMIYKQARISIKGGQFYNGLAAVKNIYNKWGYINIKGGTVIPFNFDEAESFGNNINKNIAKVSSNGRVFFIDSTGKEVAQ
jgi:hypothetical protein